VPPWGTPPPVLNMKPEPLGLSHGSGCLFCHGTPNGSRRRQTQNGHIWARFANQQAKLANLEAAVVSFPRLLWFSRRASTHAAPGEQDTDMHRPCAAPLRGRWISPVTACIRGMQLQRPRARGLWPGGGGGADGEGKGEWSVCCSETHYPTYTGRTHACASTRWYSGTVASRAKDALGKLKGGGPGTGLGADLAKSLGAINSHERPNFYGKHSQKCSIQ
jgi:hypothetical protein